MALPPFLLLFALNVALRTIAEDVPDALLRRIESFQLPNTAVTVGNLIRLASEVELGDAPG